MKQVKAGWVIKNINAGDFLQSEHDDEFGSLVSAHVFKLKREAVDNVNDACKEGHTETILKVKITAELL